MSDTKFVFSGNFEKQIDLLCKAYDKLYTALNGLKNEKFGNYGLCCVDYGFRIIRPSDVATYVDYLLKMMQSRQLDFGSPTDLNVFNVSFVKKVLKENGSDSLEKAMENACGLSWINPKRTNLDSIRSMLERECFRTMIYSNWEMMKRVRSDQFESDLKLISDMGFVRTMKNVVNAIPGILNGDDYFKGIGNSHLVDLVRVNIEEMIIFVFALNIRTMMSMKRYGSPRSSYDVPSSSHEVLNFNESVDVSKCRPVFIVLTEGKTPLMSAGIRHITHSNFTHVSIGFDPSLNKMYSFGGPYQGDSYSTDSFGCRIESMGDGILADKYVKVFVCWISADSVYKMMETCEDYINNQSDTRFNWGMIRNFILGIDKDMGSDKYHQICSSFVNLLFKNVGIQLFDDKNVPSPVDYENVAGDNKDKFVQIYYGKASGYSDKYFVIADKFATKKKSQQFDDVVTECCLLKTNRFVFSNKIPYNCNFRDIVCNDMHPHFKDTKSALMYILGNVDSPICMLLTEYASKQAMNTLMNGDVMDDSFLKMITRVCPCECSFVDHHEFKKYTTTDTEDDYYKKWHNIGMQTDPNWLDKIAYGNNFLDGNYRRDAMGTGNSMPIANTLDMIWKMYSVDSCDNKTLADNICKIGGLMLNIIRVYSHNRLSNWEFVRDVLSVLGELLTRSMLHLYANNTEIISLSDTMEDTNDPGYMYSEAFYIMEADENNQQQQSNGKVQGATIAGDTSKPGAVGGALASAKAAAKSFLKWVIKAFGHIVEDFKNRHVNEMNAVLKDNAEINDKISAAVGKDYIVTLNGFRDYDFKPDVVKGLFSSVAEYMDPKKFGDKEYSVANVLAEAYSKTLSQATISADIMKDDKKRAEALVTWALYGKYPYKPDQNNQNKALDNGTWTKILNSLKEFSNNQKLVADQFKNDLENAGKKVEAQTTDEKNSANVNKEILTKLSLDSAAIQTALMKQFFKFNYETYSNIVNNFKSKGESSSDNNNNEQQQPAEQTEKPDGDQVAPAAPEASAEATKPAEQ